MPVYERYFRVVLSASHRFCGGVIGSGIAQTTAPPCHFLLDGKAALAVHFQFEAGKSEHEVVVALMGEAERFSAIVLHFEPNIGEFAQHRGFQFQSHGAFPVEVDAELSAFEYTPDDEHPHRIAKAEPTVLFFEQSLDGGMVEVNGSVAQGGAQAGVVDGPATGPLEIQRDFHFLGQHGFERLDAEVETAQNALQQFKTEFPAESAGFVEVYIGNLRVLFFQAESRAVGHQHFFQRAEVHGPVAPVRHEVERLDAVHGRQKGGGIVSFVELGQQGIALAVEFVEHKILIFKFENIWNGEKTT